MKNIYFKTIFVTSRIWDSDYYENFVMDKNNLSNVHTADFKTQLQRIKY